jgi:hypothetical protein
MQKKAADGIEEWFESVVLPVDTNSAGAGALSPK